MQGPSSQDEVFFDMHLGQLGEIDAFTKVLIKVASSVIVTCIVVQELIDQVDEYRQLRQLRRGEVNGARGK